MKLMLAVVALSISMLFVSCNAQKQAQTNGSQAPDDISDAVITLERQNCMGPCPVYTIEIHGTGQVYYNGKQFVQIEGTKEHTIQAETVRTLVEQFYEIGYFDFAERYSGEVIKHVNDQGDTVEIVQEISDLPACITSISIGGNSKTVVNRYGAPESLQALEKQIDVLSNCEQYIKTES